MLGFRKTGVASNKNKISGLILGKLKAHMVDKLVVIISRYSPVWYGGKTNAQNNYRIYWDMILNHLENLAASFDKIGETTNSRTLNGKKKVERLETGDVETSIFKNC